MQLSHPHSAVKKVYLASGNVHKAEELTLLFAREGIGMEVRSAREIGGMPDVDENAPTFEGNAMLKAEALFAKVPSGAGVLADDSGLEVEWLLGEPGVRSARYAGEKATDAQNRAKLLEAMREAGPEERQAEFRCCLVLIDPEGERYVFHGVSKGTILTEERGGQGFGYDSLFVPEGDTRTYAEMSEEEKGQSSHRARAVQELAKWWKSHCAEGNAE